MLSELFGVHMEELLVKKAIISPTVLNIDTEARNLDKRYFFYYKRVFQKAA